MNSKPAKTNANSKTAPKKNGQKCQHVFKQGKKKGKRCNKSCRGSRCCDHSPKKAEYKQKKFEEQQREKNQDKLTLLLEKIANLEEISNKDLYTQGFKMKALENEAHLLIRTVRGYRLALEDEETEKKLEDFKKKQMETAFQKHIEKLETQWEKDEYIRTHDVSNHEDAVDEERFFKQYSGRKDRIELLLASKLKKRDKLVEKMKIQKKILMAYQKRYEELQEDKDDIDIDLDDL